MYNLVFLSCVVISLPVLASCVFKYRYIITLLTVRTGQTGRLSVGPVKIRRCEGISNKTYSLMKIFGFCVCLGFLCIFLPVCFFLVFF